MLFRSTAANIGRQLIDQLGQLVGIVLIIVPLVAGSGQLRLRLPGESPHRVIHRLLVRAGAGSRQQRGITMEWNGTNKCWLQMGPLAGDDVVQRKWLAFNKSAAGKLVQVINDQKGIQWREMAITVHSHEGCDHSY